MAIREEMTPYERVMTAISRGKPDRVPVVACASTYAVRRAGYKYHEILNDPDKFVRCQVKMLHESGVDALFDVSASAVIGEALGAGLRVLDDDPPVSAEPLVKSYEGIVDLEFPDVRSSGRVPYLLDVIGRLRKAVGREVPIWALAAPPFRLAGVLRGTQTFYKDLIRNPEAAMILMEKCTPPAIEYALATIDAGADVVWIPDPVSGATVISRKHYERFNFPYMRQVFEAIRKRNVKVMFHACGDWHDRLDLLADAADGIHLAAEADLPRAKQELGARTSLMGNVKSVEVMLYGTTRDCEDASYTCFEQAAPNGGFILSPDCALPPATPAENLRALVEASKKFAGTGR